MFSVPRNLSIENMNVTSAVACWSRPRYGKARKFEIRYSSQDEAVEQRITIHHRPRRRQCMRLASLVPGANYDVEVRGMSGHSQCLGVAAKISFKIPAHADKTGRAILVCYSVLITQFRSF